MFSSTNSGNPFQHLPSLFHQSPPPPPPPLPFLGHESDDTFLHHHHNNDFLLGHFPPPHGPNNPSSSLAEAVMSMAVANNHPIHATTTHHDCSYGGHSGAGFLPGKKTVKKDRHSKITTAKGPRERRVRLSIKIARKFFDLQDMLGFDKASRTLEWLLINSKSAIKEVVRRKSSCKSLSSASSECEVLSGMNDQTGGPPDVGVLSGRESEVKKARESEDKAAAFNLLARESRAKARARARERTREKMCTRRLDELKKIPDHYNHHHHIFSQLRSSAQAEAHEKLGGGGGSIISASHAHQNIASSLKLVSQLEESSSRPNSSTSSHANLANIIEESIFIKRKLKPAPLFATSPQNHLLFSKDLSLNSSSNNNSYFPHPPQNWDINTPSARSNTLCAMTNMNLSTEFQMLGKPLDGHNNLSLR